MSVVNHNAVLATTWKTEEADRFRLWISFLSEPAKRQFAMSLSNINGYHTICLFPDGSSEGWADSAEGDRLRAAFIEELKRGDYPLEEGQAQPSSPWDYVEIGYGEFGAAVLRTNCYNHYGDEAYAEPIEEAKQ